MATFTIDDVLQRELNKRAQTNSLRALSLLENKIDFSSNDYLGFTQNPQLKQAILEQIGGLHQLGSGGSRLLTGNSQLIETLEEQVAHFHDGESALFFNSGYEANVGLIASVTKRNDTLVYDQFIHASLREGIQLSHANSFSFMHNHMQDLQKKLQKATGQLFIIIESVYSMDGDCCLLPEIIALAKQYNANIILDEAHATGVIGKDGKGMAQHLNLHNAIFARVYTCGKAIGSNGAFIIGNRLLKNYLINFCKPFIYSTAPNLMQVVAVREAYLLLQNAQQTITKLHLNCAYFYKKIEECKQLQMLPSQSAIVSILIAGNQQVKDAAAKLQADGFDVRAIVSPTVPLGAERLRICIHSFNTFEQIDQLVNLLGELNG